MTTARATLICRSQAPAADGWYQLYPRGEFPVVATIAGKDQEIDLVLDDDAFRAILAAREEDAKAANWSGYLVGQEHFAQMADRSSEAHAWCRELEIREDGLWGRFEKTPLGEASIGSIYKFRSPVSDLAKISGRRWRPVNIVDVGLTNKPKFKSLAAAAGRDGGVQTNNMEQRMREQLIALLGLAADATDEQILAAVTANQEAVKTAKAEVMARDADAFIADHADLIPEADRAGVKASFIQARDVVTGIYKGLRVTHPKPAADGKGPRVLARESAKTPAGRIESTVTDTDEQTAARISARARELVGSKVCRTLAQAYQQATKEIGSGDQPAR